MFCPLCGIELPFPPTILEEGRYICDNAMPSCPACGTNMIVSWLFKNGEGTMRLLIVKTNAKINLANRPGYQYRLGTEDKPGGWIPEKTWRDQEPLL